MATAAWNEMDAEAQENLTHAWMDRRFFLACADGRYKLFKDLTTQCVSENRVCAVAIVRCLGNDLVVRFGTYRGAFWAISKDEIFSLIRSGSDIAVEVHPVRESGICPEEFLAMEIVDRAPRKIVIGMDEIYP